MSRYHDDVWTLAPLLINPSARNLRIFWQKFPGALRAQFRALAWHMINTNLPDTFLVGRASAWRARPSCGGVYRAALAWRHFARWLHQHGISSLAACTSDIFDAYLHESPHLKAMDRQSLVNELAALTRLWAIDHASTHPVGIQEPPWSRGDDDQYLPTATPGGENSTEPIAPATMGPLLVWSLRLIDDLADDIIAAVADRQRIVARARAAASTAASRAALRAHLRQLAAEGQPLPSHGSAEAPKLAITYLAGISGATANQVQGTCEREPWPAYLRRNPGPCPLPTPIAGHIDGRPWTDHIDFNDAPQLWRHLGTAAFIVVNYLTGMRPAETLALRRGCCTETPDGPAALHGQPSKTPRHHDQNAPPQPRETPWVAIQPVVSAVRLLERMTDGRDLLFDVFAHSPKCGNQRGALASETIRDRLVAYQAWINMLVDRLDRPDESVPPDPRGPITANRFRRTLAWHIARRPGGLVALAVQYGHLRTSVTAGYASRSRDGIHDLLDIETARATADTLARLHDDLTSGSGISGPAAARAIRAAAHTPTFAGAIHTARQARQLLSNRAVTVYDNPHTYLMCVFDRDKALCQRLEPANETPQLDRCQPACTNIARTDRHADALLAEAEAVDLQASPPTLPAPLAERLRSRAERLRQLATHHRQHRITQSEAQP